MANESVTIRAKNFPDHQITVDKSSADALVLRGDWEAVPDDTTKGKTNGSGNARGRSGPRRSGNPA